MSQVQNNYFNIPNVVSFLALFLACTAIALLINQQFYYSFATIFLAFIMDALDGFLARKLKSTSDFGKQLDGYVDLFTYLIYPALSYYIYFRLQTLIASFILFIFVACGIFRLARFSIVGFIFSETRPGAFSYQGLPVYFNHLFLLVAISIHALFQTYFNIPVYILILVNSYLMISKIQFPKPQRVLPYVLLLLLISGFFYFLGIYASH